MEQDQSHDKQQGPQSRAWYGAAIEAFIQTPVNEVVNSLIVNSDFPVLPTQRDAWIGSLDILGRSLEGLEGSLFLEFNIPRMGRRIDAVVIVGPVCLVVEFKVGETDFNRQDIDQAWDYALDLKNFHKASHSVSIVPILVATEANISLPTFLDADHDDVYKPVCVGGDGLRADAYIR